MNWPQCGQPIGRWTVDRMIGEGSFGTVYLVHETHTRQVAALKINLGLNVTATPEEFRAERNNVRKSLAPEHTTDFYDSGTWCDREYYVMELAQPISPSVKLSARRLFRLFWGFSYGIEAFHANGRIHCDIKPANLATIDGKPKILDLGCVRLIKNAKKHPERIGTWKKSPWGQSPCPNALFNCPRQGYGNAHVLHYTRFTIEPLQQLRSISVLALIPP